MTNGRSSLHDTRRSAVPGQGLPSCSRELSRIPANRNDPSGYYAEIGVPPWASGEQIRQRCRELYFDLHPDTGSAPDVDRLVRVRNIAGVLCDDRRRQAYNRTPPGKRLLDDVYRSELQAGVVGSDDWTTLQALLAVPDKPDRPAPSFFDYLSQGRRLGDRDLAQRWYGCLVSVAPLVGYRRRILVLLHDGMECTFHSDTAVMSIPRSWPVSDAQAFGLFVAVARRRHPAWPLPSSPRIV